MFKQNFSFSDDYITVKADGSLHSKEQCKLRSITALEFCTCEVLKIETDMVKKNNISEGDSDFWLSWNKWDEFIDWCDEEKPAPEIRVEKQRSYWRLIQQERTRTVSAQHCQKGIFSSWANILSLMPVKLLHLFGMRRWTGWHTCRWLLHWQEKQEGSENHRLIRHPTSSARWTPARQTQLWMLGVDW